MSTAEIINGIAAIADENKARMLAIICCLVAIMTGIILIALDTVNNIFSNWAWIPIVILYIILPFFPLISFYNQIVQNYKNSDFLLRQRVIYSDLKNMQLAKDIKIDYDIESLSKYTKKFIKLKDEQKSK